MTDLEREGKTEQGQMSERAKALFSKLLQYRAIVSPWPEDIIREAARLFDEMERESGSVAEMVEALRSISTLVVDPTAADTFTYSNLCEAVSTARAALAKAGKR